MWSLTGSPINYVLTALAAALCRPMVSDSINNSLFHQLAEQLQQQNLEQFQKQLMEHQQKVGPGPIDTPHTECPTVRAALGSSRRSLLYEGRLRCFVRSITVLVVSPPRKSMSMEPQDSIFGPENPVPSVQSTSQPQLPEAEKLDDSMDNQQQVPKALNHLLVLYR